MAAPSSFITTEVLPPALDSTSQPPTLFDGTTRLYISYTCPYARRTWIARNYKGLQEKIKLVPIDLENRPAWYKEKVYPPNKVNWVTLQSTWKYVYIHYLNASIARQVPSLEHNNEVKGESLDLIKYIDTHFEGPALLPDDPAKQQFAEELLSYTGSLNKVMFTALPSKEDVGDDVGAALNKIEDALSKFDDGPFFLGQFSLVDIAYVPFIEGYQILFSDIKNYDITKGRPKLALWIEELNKIDAYLQTRYDPQKLVARTKKRLGIA